MSQANKAEGANPSVPPVPAEPMSIRRSQLLRPAPSLLKDAVMRRCRPFSLSLKRRSWSGSLDQPVPPEKSTTASN